MLEAPEFEAGDTARISLSLHYDLWMTVVVLIQVFDFMNKQKRIIFNNRWYLWKIKERRNYIKNGVQIYTR